MNLHPTFDDILEAQEYELRRLIHESPPKETLKLLKRAESELDRRLKSIPSGTFDYIRLSMVMVQVRAVMLSVDAAIQKKNIQWNNAVKKAASKHMMQMLKAGEAAFPQAASTSFAEIREATLFTGRAGAGDSLVRRFNTYANRYTQSVIQRIEQELSVGIATNKSTDEIVGSLSDKKKGIRADEWKIERIVRTELSHAYSTFYLEDAKAIHSKDNTLRVRWTELVDDATGRPMDKRVGEDSIQLHGQVRVPGERFKDYVLGGEPMMPPNRPHDRGRLVIVRGAWKKSA